MTSIGGELRNTIDGTLINNYTEENRGKNEDGRGGGRRKGGGRGGGRGGGGLAWEDIVL